MPWIESHPELESHPKTLYLSSRMCWSLNETIGVLLRFWWWCTKYAEDGDLRKYNDNTLAAAVGLGPDKAKAFVDAMSGSGEAVSGFIDRSPYFRVHDWWSYYGRFLQVKYKHYPDKWKKIQAAYNYELNGSLNGSSNHKPNLTKPNLTKPNLTKETASPVCGKMAQEVINLHKINIMAIIGQVTRDDRHGVVIPVEVIEATCGQFLRDAPKIKNQYKWFTRVLNAEMDRYNADKNIQEAEVYKDPARLGAALSERMRYKHD